MRVAAGRGEITVMLSILIFPGLITMGPTTHYLFLLKSEVYPSTPPFFPVPAVTLAVPIIVVTPEAYIKCRNLDFVRDVKEEANSRIMEKVDTSIWISSGGIFSEKAFTGKRGFRR